MNAFAKIRKALNTGDANDLLAAMDALAELERAAKEPVAWRYRYSDGKYSSAWLTNNNPPPKEDAAVADVQLLYAALPTPVAEIREPVEVDDEIARKLWREWFNAGCMTGLDTARFWLRVWQRELGPTLGMVPPDARADARIAELERDIERLDAQWREELRIYRETENKRIAELEQSVTVRDTEIARLETDLELARRDAERINRLSAHLADDITICPPGKHGKGDGWLIFWQTGWDNYGQIGEETHGATLRDAIDAARAGNGGGV